MIRISPLLQRASLVGLRAAIAALVLGSFCAALAESNLPRPGSAPDETPDRPRAEARDGAAASLPLTNEIAAASADAEKLAQDLVASARSVQRIEEDLSRLEGRIAELDSRALVLRRSLGERRDVLSGLVAALQRAGLRLSGGGIDGPEDLSATTEAAALLGAITSDVAAEAERMARDLAALARLQEDGLAERVRLGVGIAASQRERARLQDLVVARRVHVATLQDRLRTEKATADALAREAAAAADLAMLTSRQEEPPVPAAEGATKEAALFRDLLARAIERDPQSLAPDRPFTKSRGSLIRPAAGTVTRTFGQVDGPGGASHGIVIATRSRAVVTSPADARVAYAGSFRSYGRLLILDAGEGYYILLSGLDQITVDTARFVLAGEPVGQMGETASWSAATPAVERNGPVLYVEFRKDGGPIDPSPWWARSQGEKVRG